MKATRRNTILRELGESIKSNDTILWSLRRKCFEQDLTDNITFAKSEKVRLQKEFNSYCVNCPDESKDTFNEYLVLKGKYYSSRVDRSVNYMM